MIKRAFLAMTALLAVAVLTTLVAAPAHADSGDQRPCVTMSEYYRVHRGMTQAQVHDIFDTVGHYQAYYSDPGWVYERDIYRDYATCGRWNGGRRIELNFDNYMHNRPGMILWSKRLRALI